MGKMIIKATKMIFNSDKICRSYSDLNLASLFWNTVYIAPFPNYCRLFVKSAISTEESLA